MALLAKIDPNHHSFAGLARINLGPFSNPMADHPGNAMPRHQERYPVPPISGHFRISEKVLKLFLTVHTQRLKPVSGLSSPDPNSVSQRSSVEEGSQFRRYKRIVLAILYLTIFWDELGLDLPVSNSGNDGSPD